MPKLAELEIMQRLLKPLLLSAVACLLLAFLLKLGTTVWLPVSPPEVAPPGADALPAPGLAVPALALFDALLLWVLLLIVGGTILPPALLARGQGPATLVATLIAAAAAITAVTAALALLTVMLGLLLAPPFGTLIYLAVYGSFDTSAARLVLSLCMALKLVSAGLLVAAHRRFLENRSLMLLIATSLALSSVVALLHGLVPGILVSITDAIAAALVAVVTLIWALPFALGGIVSTSRALKPPAVAASFRLTAR